MQLDSEDASSVIFDQTSTFHFVPVTVTVTPQKPQRLITLSVKCCNYAEESDAFNLARHMLFLWIHCDDECI